MLPPCSLEAGLDWITFPSRALNGKWALGVQVGRCCSLKLKGGRRIGLDVGLAKVRGKFERAYSCVRPTQHWRNIGPHYCWLCINATNATSPRRQRRLPIGRLLVDAVVSAATVDSKQATVVAFRDDEMRFFLTSSARQADGRLKGTGTGAAPTRAVTVALRSARIDL